jgi:hypothetical protein
MDCREFESMLADYLGGELGEGDRSRCDDHVALCGSCGDEAASLAETVAAMEGLAPAAEGSLGRMDALARFRSALAIAGILIVGVCLGWVMKPEPDVFPERGGVDPARVVLVEGDAEGPSGGIGRSRLDDIGLLRGGFGARDVRPFVSFVRAYSGTR